METGLPIEWGKDKHIRWKAPLPGQGHSNPVIAGGKVFVTASSGFQESRLHVLCLDQASGKQRWHRQFRSTGSTLCHAKSNMAAPSPVTDGKAVYALFATGDLVALDGDGNLLWYRSLARDYPTLANNVGMAASPVLWQDMLILPLDNAGESFVAGVDVKTGQNRWKTARTREINWVSPLLVPQGNNAQVVIGALAELTAYDVHTGKKLWTYAGNGFSNTSTPVLGDGLVLAAGGQFTAVRPGTAKAGPKLVWQTSKLHPNISSPLYYDKRVYSLNPPNILVCANAADGKVLWQQRLAEGTYWSSPVAADGKIYAVNDAGTTTVVQVGDKPNVLARNALDDPILATPAIAGGCLFLRSDQYLYCVSGDRERFIE
ncbi:MAG: PQQ-binding-like beta-propeller repeat protein [Planctomycetes bacterium]|nr:PQQ-binding-like beta-propeller repeat protein [Planctomycetota bacterium]